ncbi:class I SAM-dependent RNA methyltransferase [Marinicauda salina]|uniref:Class I SAM-dependent RNA methyltransferase n=1 Tax=Marinicauda salina TaxID=2135793 RepID=A0A2U2BSJ2_9PROT|nr:RsmD family RNA methyltransferase [Marinicauda salina]PWE16967.1 class I SAM-dependent RNA methyltransferase [Marinicauda salina]
MTRRRRKKTPPAETRELTAEAVGARGDAIAPGPVYVPGLLPGETARVEVRGDRGRVVERLSDSPDRVEPFCPIHGRCGGCALQYWRAEVYRDWKRDRVVAALARAGLAAEVGPLLDARGAGRRRLTLHAERRGGAFVFGYAERASDRLVDAADCPVAAEPIRNAFPDLRRLADALAPAKKGRIDIAVAATEGGLDVAVKGVREITLDHRLVAAELAQSGGWARITISGEPVAERAKPFVRCGPAEIVPPPGGFLQATAAGEAALADVALAAVDGAKRVIDLYAGSGAFALRLAEHAPVLAVEGDAEALAALRAAADHTQGIKPVETMKRDLALEPLASTELEGADLVVLDPPRSGAREQAERLADSAVPRIVSVSCNPATFARDAAILVEGGYSMGEVTPVDQFAWTGHVECAAVFERAG